MPRKAKELLRLLKRNGFVLEDVTGSHYKLRNPETGATVILPFHSREMKRYIENGILKAAGLEKEIKK